jgi:hypothetical protein
MLSLNWSYKAAGRRSTSPLKHTEKVSETMCSEAPITGEFSWPCGNMSFIICHAASTSAWVASESQHIESAESVPSRQCPGRCFPARRGKANSIHGECGYAPFWKPSRLSIKIHYHWNCTKQCWQSLNQSLLLKIKKKRITSGDDKFPEILEMHDSSPSNAIHSFPVQNHSIISV